MSSRGSKAINGHVTTDEYVTYEVLSSGAKVLVGTSKKYHSLPDYSHTPNSVYVKLKKDKKTLHEFRIYDSNSLPIIEIAYHPEPVINNGDRDNNILHYHLFDGLKRKDAIRMNDNQVIKEKYKIYLKEFDLYD